MSELPGGWVGVPGTSTRYQVHRYLLVGTNVFMDVHLYTTRTLDVVGHVGVPVRLCRY